MATHSQGKWHGPEEHSCWWRVYLSIYLTGRWFAQCPLCFLKGLCVLGLALCTVRAVITITVNISFDEWNKGELSWILTGGREVMMCSVLAITLGRTSYLLNRWIWHTYFQSPEAPSQVHHSHLVGMGQLRWFRVHRDMAAPGYDHLLVLFQERLEHTGSECGLNK